VWYLSRGVTDYEEIVPYADIGIRYDVVVVCEELCDKSLIFSVGR
jgi:hypothetical protein